MSRADESALEDVLREGLAAGVAPALTAWVAVDGVERARCGAGADPEAIFDLASLTKPRVVVDRVMRDVAEGRYDLDDSIALGEGESTSFRALLGHRASLPAWEDLWSVATSALGEWEPGSEAVWRCTRERIARLRAERPEAGVVYSDLGYIALGHELERRHGARLSDGVPGFQGAPGALPTGRCARRGRALEGEVHDLNCWVLGGAAGHAGLFGRAGDLGAWALDLVRSARGQGGSIDGGVVRAFWSRDNLLSGSTWVLGWDTPSSAGSSGGSFMSDEAVGHLGFTGTSVWIDPPAGFVAVLLTNRVARDEGSQEHIRAFRPRFHDAIRAHFGLA